MKKRDKIIGYALTLGATMALAALSFTGMLALAGPGAFVWGAVVAGLAFVVEGQVYKKNIFAAINSLARGDYNDLKRTIAEQELKKLALTHPNNDFLQDYFKQSSYVKALKENHDHEAIEREEKKLIAMQDLFISYLESKEEKITDDANNEKFKSMDQLFASTENKEAFKRTFCNRVKRKKIWIRAAWIFSLAAGISSGFAALAAAAGEGGGLAVLGISLTAISWCFIVPIVIFAAAGYTLLMYHGISDMIKNDSVQKWVHKTLEFFKDKNQSVGVKILAGIGVASLVALAIFATICTASAWWFAAKEGAELIPYIVSAARWIRDITVPLMASATLIFNFTNALKSLKVLGSKIEHWYGRLTGKIKSGKTWAQFFNPAEILLETIETGIFVGHLSAVAMTTERVPYMDKGLPTATGTAMDFLVDLHYLKKKQVKEKNHDEKAIELDETEPFIEKEEPKNTSIIIQEDDDHSHDHDHGNKVTQALSYPLRYAGAWWHTKFSANPNKIEAQKEARKAFHLEEETKNVTPPSFSLTW